MSFGDYLFLYGVIGIRTKGGPHGRFTYREYRELQLRSNLEDPDQMGARTGSVAGRAPHLSGAAAQGSPPIIANIADPTSTAFKE